MKVIPEMRRVH